MKSMLEAKIDRMRYYNETVDLEFLETLLETVDDECPDCEPCYDQGVNIVIQNVLKNPKLKTRGEMIEAARREYVTEVFDGDIREE